MPQLTPPMNARGTYQLLQPWIAPAQVIYTCKAIRSFADIYDDGVDVYNTYYAPLGLTQAQFQLDVVANANIITLIADSSDPNTLFGGSYIIYVPDTYIQAYPSTSNVPYSRMAMCVDLGALPDYLDLTALQSQVTNVVSDTIGVVAPNLNVYVYKAPSTGTVTGTQNNVLEAARLAAISNRTTDYALNKQLTTQVANLQQQITTLTNLLSSNGLWPPQPYSSLTILQDNLFKAFNTGSKTPSITVGTPSTGGIVAPYDTGVTLTGNSGATMLAGTATLSYKAADIISLQAYILAATNVNMQPAVFSLGAPAVLSSNPNFNTTVTMTGNGPLSGTLTLNYNRLDLTVFLGTITVSSTAAALAAMPAGATVAGAMQLLNSLKNLVLTTADYTVTNPSTGVYTFTPVATSVGWMGTALTLLAN